MKLYVKDITREPNDTLYSFLYKVLHLDGDGWGRCAVNATYLDPEFKKQQCITNKYRSFDELVLISKTYFRVSDKAVAKVIKKILDNFDYTSLVLCDTAEKWILYYGLNKSKNIKYCAKYNYSYNKTNDPLKGIYSFDDIIALMGLTQEDIKIENG
jgi:hypothetical protein